MRLVSMPYRSSQTVYGTRLDSRIVRTAHIQSSGLLIQSQSEQSMIGLKQVRLEVDYDRVD